MIEAARVMVPMNWADMIAEEVNRRTRAEEAHQRCLEENTKLVLRNRELEAGIAECVCGAFDPPRDRPKT